MVLLDKFSMGIGDRFARQGRAQLMAFIKARDMGARVVPIWNKSHREHTALNTSPKDVLVEAQDAVKVLNWQDPYFVDADHVGLHNVDLFTDFSNFFTLEVADFIGKPATKKDVDHFLSKNKKYIGKLVIPGIDDKFATTKEDVKKIATTYLLAAKEAGKIYRRIESVKGKDNFITEVSMDETSLPQKPLEIFFILSALAMEGVPVQTIAPKFSGHFHKGVDYTGNVSKFAKEFNQILAIIKYAKEEFSLPSNLKLSIHSGSDKFSLYPAIRKVLEKHDAGLHLKTAGTTWLEEVAGLALAKGQGLRIAKKIYQIAYSRFDELCKPYSKAIDIKKSKLPDPQDVEKWNSEIFYHTIRHDPENDHYDSQFRQMMHVGYKVAGELGDEYLNALKEYEEIISVNVTENIYEKHLKPLFVPPEEE